MPTINDLRQQAATIKNATQVGENTANRVGGTFETVADLLEQAGGGGQGIPSVDLSQLNALRTPADQTDANPTVYNVTTMHTLSGTTIKVGTLFVFSDGARSVVTQVLVSNYQVDGGGNISSPNASQITIYYRMFNIVQETWSTWTLYAGGSGGGTIDPYPVRGSDNAVASNGVFEGLQKAAPEVNINDLDDLGDFVDMRTGESSAYTLKYMHTQSSTWLRVGVVMCFANLAQNTLTQIVFSNCVVDGGGNLIPNSATNVMNIYYRFKQFSGNPPEGMTIGEWSAWTKFEGGGGGEIDAYTKSETNALLAQKQDNLTFDNSPTPNSNNPVKSSGIYTALDGKFEKAGGTITGNVTFNGSIILHDLAQIQEGNVEMTDVLDERYELKLTWDNTPTASSNNPVKSGGVYDYVINSLSGYTPTANFATINGSVITQGGNIQVLVPQGAITIDAAPSPNSQNAVSSGGVYDAIEGGFYY